VIRVEVPHHLRVLVGVEGDILLDVDGPVTQASVLDALEARFPVLRGTIRDRATKRRRPYLRFFACDRDVSFDRPDAPLPDAVARGERPFTVIGAMSGG